jgi:hypothetical protein
VTIAPPAPVVVTSPRAAAPAAVPAQGVGVEMVERTVRFTVPSSEAILPANLFKAGMVASLAAAITPPASAAPAMAAIAAPVAPERDDQLALDFVTVPIVPVTAVAMSPLKPAVDIASYPAAVPSRIIDVAAEDVSDFDAEYGEIDLASDPSADDVVATARRFARVPAE